MNIFSNINENTIDKWAMRLHEPKWLREQRIKCWDMFQDIPEPNWKKEKIPQLKWNEAIREILPSWEERNLNFEKKTSEEISGNITFEGNRVIKIFLDRDLANQGVIFCDMRTAVLERADLLESIIGKIFSEKEDKLSVFAKIFWINGYFISIPRGIKIKKPFHIKFIQTKKGEQMFVRNIVHLEENSAGLVEEISESETDFSEKVLCSSDTEIFVKKDAHLQFLSNKNFSENVYSISKNSFLARKDSKITSFISCLGLDSGASYISGIAKDKGARIQNDGIFLGQGKQQQYIKATMNHESEETDGLMRYNVILKDKSYISLEGSIRTLPEASKSKSRLDEKILMMSDTSSCDVVPALKINTKNVQISHSASLAQVNKEKLFYLMSRGLSEKSAKALLVEGFLENIIRDITDKKHYDMIKSLVRYKLFSQEKK